MDNIGFWVEYSIRGEYSHKYWEEWEKTDLFCPNCGSQSVHYEVGAGDYYTGPHHICTECGASFALPYGADVSENNQDRQRFVKIKELGNG